MIPSVGPEADLELTESAIFYAREAGSDVGFAFILEYERSVALLCARPHLGAPWKSDRRRFPLRKFPFSIIYYVRGEELRVIAIAHHRRKPEYWSGRA